MRRRSHVPPRPFCVYAVAVFAAGLSALALSWEVLPPVLDLRIAILVLAAALSELFAFSFATYNMSLSYPLAMAAAFLSGPTSACLVAGASSVSMQDIKSRKSAYVMGFNFGQLLLSTALGAWSYIACEGRTLVVSSGHYAPLTAADFPEALVATAVAGLVSYSANVVMTSAGIALHRRGSFRSVAWSGLALMPAQVVLAMMGLLMAQVMAVSVVSFSLFVFPLLVARQFYQRTLALRDAYRDTVRALVGTIEAKDDYTKGHSLRVAEYSIALGEAMRLDERSLERLERAALLHDLGKLSLPAHILNKPGPLSPDEYGLMSGHASAGAEMVQRIPHVRDLAPIVAAHHERPDGLGYPAGVTGEGLGELARILAVADSFDAMTSDRPYRCAMTIRAAVAELVAGAGAQFDAGVVSAAQQVFSGGPGPTTGQRVRLTDPSQVQTEAVPS